MLVRRLRLRHTLIIQRTYDAASALRHFADAIMLLLLIYSELRDVRRY